MLKHEIFTSEQGQNLMDYISFQTMQQISVAHLKGHKYYAYRLTLEVDEEKEEGCIVMPSIESYSTNDLSDVKKWMDEHSQTVCVGFDIGNGEPKMLNY